MIPALLTTGLGVIATTVAFRLNRRALPAEERLHLWGALRALMRILGPMIVLAGFLGAIHASGRLLPRPAPMIIRHTVSLSDFGVEVTLPSTWTLEPGQERTDFVATDSDTGAVLAGVVSVTDPHASLRVAIDRIVEDQRARFGTVESSSRGLIGFGPLHAQWVELSFHGQGDPTRIKTIALRRGARILMLTCNGGERAQNACDSAIHPEAMAH
jgi:hypothetical protein